MVVKLTDVANFFVQKGIDEEKPISQMKLQKLMFYTRGLFLANKDIPLFEGEFQAWMYGPVLPDLYQMAKSYESRPIKYSFDETTEEMIEEILGEGFEDISKHIQGLEIIWSKYGKYTGWQLSEMTHKEGTPWQQVFNEKHNKPIKDSLIKEYFRKAIGRD